MKTCIIVPVYNHEQAVTRVLAALKDYRLHCFLVNDGSSEACTKVLAEVAAQAPGWITLINRDSNGGKGAAVIAGFHAAIAQGFTHAIQIDADGQHDAGVISRFLELEAIHPDSMILGQPVFDESAPKGRLYGRRLTNLWIVINTLSFAIGDGLCGYRLYPLAEVDRLLKSSSIGQGMDFDVDIAVRLYWQGVEVINLPVKVIYPVEGVSHFKLWRDNMSISKVHARLFFGMLARAPRLINRHFQ